MKDCNSCSSKNTKAGGCKNEDSCAQSCSKVRLSDWLADIEPPNKTKKNFVEVRFKNERKVFYENIKNLSLQMGDCVVVEASSGYDIGTVNLKGELVRVQMRSQKKAEKLKKVLRKALKEDINKWQYFREKESLMIPITKKIIKELGVKMKLSQVEYQGDGSKATFYYTAEERVDFRELIKKLNVLFRVNVEMRQIGYRQEASKIGGIGSCGRELCCSSWLRDFRSVNTSAARYQQLAINTQKLTGQCGKLKCCLNFELETYLEAIKDFPSGNTKLYTEKEIAFCIKIDILKKEMWFNYANNPDLLFKLTVEQVKKLIKTNQMGKKIPSLEKISLNDNLVLEGGLKNFYGKKGGELIF